MSLFSIEEVTQDTDPPEVIARWVGKKAVAVHTGDYTQYYACDNLRITPKRGESLITGKGCRSLECRGNYCPNKTEEVKQLTIKADPVVFPAELRELEETKGLLKRKGISDKEMEIVEKYYRDNADDVARSRLNI